MGLVALMNNGKTNVDGRNEYGAVMRSKEVGECPFGAMALYMFARFEVNHEDFPDLQRQANWYRTKLYKHRSPFESFSYEQERLATSKAHKACNIKISKVTHAARPFGATKVLGQSNHGHVRQAGRWKGGKMERCYLQELPLVSMRIHAGFGRKQGQYYLRRAVLDPPSELAKKIFPTADIWRERLEDENYDCDKDMLS